MLTYSPAYLPYLGVMHIPLEMVEGLTGESCHQLQRLKVRAYLIYRTYLLGYLPTYFLTHSLATAPQAGPY